VQKVIKKVIWSPVVLLLLLLTNPARSALYAGLALLLAFVGNRPLAIRVLLISGAVALLATVPEALRNYRERGGSDLSTMKNHLTGDVVSLGLIVSFVWDFWGSKAGWFPPVMLLAFLVFTFFNRRSELRLLQRIKREGATTVAEEIVAEVIRNDNAPTPYDARLAMARKSNEIQQRSHEHWQFVEETLDDVVRERIYATNLRR
jgi:hypothetical protein